MRSSILFLSVGVALTMAACNKNNEKTTLNFTGDPTDYILKKVSYTYGNGHREYIYTYNNDHLVMHADRYGMNTEEPAPHNADTVKADFAYTAGRCTAMTVRTGTTGSYEILTTIEYDATGRQIKSTQHFPSSNWVHNYSYDAQQRLSGGTDAASGQARSTVFAYAGSNADPAAVTSTVQGFAYKKEWVKTTDNDANYLSAIRGLPREWCTLYNDMWYIAPFGHNVSVQKEYAGLPLVLQTTTSYSYNYNDAGLPVHITANSNGNVYNITLEYEKYK